MYSIDLRPRIFQFAKMTRNLLNKKSTFAMVRTPLETPGKAEYTIRNGDKYTQLQRKAQTSDFI
jgi:hypothetical protein